MPFTSDPREANRKPEQIVATESKSEPYVRQLRSGRTLANPISCFQELFTPNGKMTPEYLQDIRLVVIDYLREMDIRYPTHLEVDDKNENRNREFETYYVETAIQQGFPAEFVLSKKFEIALRVGIDIALTTYG